MDRGKQGQGWELEQVEEDIWGSWARLPHSLVATSAKVSIPAVLPFVHQTLDGVQPATGPFEEWSPPGPSRHHKYGGKPCGCVVSVGVVGLMSTVGHFLPGSQKVWSTLLPSPEESWP